MGTYHEKVDAYIEKSAGFAKPVLNYIREVVHETSPLITESIKWGFPFFEYKGPVCQMASFKQYCSFGFWKATLLNDKNHVLKLGDQKAGNLGEIATIADLPAKEILIDLILQAIALNEQEVKVAKPKAAPAEKAELVIPEYFTEFLGTNPKALEVFYNFSYSHKKEYAEWILDAKSEATRQKRMETALEWIAEGKSRHWKYK